MQKIILDTNVLVSALIQRNFPFYIVTQLFSDNNINLCISEELFKEYFDVLNRKKFAGFTDFIANAQILLIDIEKRALKYFPTVKLKIIKDDGDNMLLELAETCKADFLITGNTRHFIFEEYRGTKIVSPKDYRTKYISK